MPNLSYLAYFRKQLPNTDTIFPNDVATFSKCGLTLFELLAIQSTHSATPTILAAFDFVAIFWGSILRGPGWTFLNIQSFVGRARVSLERARVIFEQGIS